MTNTTVNEGTELTRDEAIQLKEQEARREKELRVSQKIEAVLLEEKMALQPFLYYSEFGVGPRVRLVEVPNQDTDEQVTIEGEAEQSNEPDPAAEPEQS